jgi:hypothetical chaperone protein
MGSGTSTLAIDFGTSNSAAGVAAGGQGRLIPLEPGQATMPTAVFFDFDARRIVYGSPAQAALIAGDEGRYMRALKSLLGTALMHESRMLIGQRMDFVQIVAHFLAEVKARAEAETGLRFDRALSGRPVRFHSEDAARDARALEDLEACYHAAGFREVRFMPEPAAAALACRDLLSPGDLGLVVDIGGGTSDFTLFRQKGAGVDILADHGIRLGGTDFDRALSLGHVMPLLGLDSEIRHVFGSQTHSAPRAVFEELATWAKIPFLYTAETRRDVAELAKSAVEPHLLNRLSRVLEEELGHDVAFAVEAGKIAANDPGALAPPEIDLTVVERGLRQPLPGPMVAATLGDMAARIAAEAVTAAEAGGMAPGDVNRLILVGGSSLMSVVETALRQRFPAAELHRGAALTAIIDGLAIASESAFD